MIRRVLWIVGICILILFSNCVERKVIKIAGSTTVQPISLRAADAFMKKHPDVVVFIQAGGSGRGISMVGEGMIDIGASSRDLKNEELKKYPSLKAHIIAKDAMAIIVNPKNPVDNLTLEQLRDIFSGKIKNWKEVGGKDARIVVVIREEGSGTRATFEKLVMRGVKVREDALQEPSNGAVRATIAKNENAIGYIGIGYVDEKVKIVRVDGVYPNMETIRSGKYKIVRNLYYVTNGEPSGIVKEFIDFVKSEEGQKIVEEEGFIRVS